MKHDHEHKFNPKDVADAATSLRPVLVSGMRAALRVVQRSGECWIRAQALHAAVAWIGAMAVADPELAKNLDAQDLAKDFAEYIKNGE